MTQTNTSNIAILIFALFSAVLLGWLTSLNPQGIPVIFTVGALIVLISIYDLKIALGILALSMLLSPEIQLAEVPRRAVVVRFDDLILVLIFFVWLSKMAVNKQLPLIETTPLNKYIYYYIGSAFLFTGMGVVSGDVNFAKAIFYLLKYTEYFIIFWMTYNIVQTKKDAKFLLKIAAVTAVIVTIYGYTKINTVVTAPFDLEPGSVGGYFIIVSAAALGTFIYHKSKTIKTFSIILFISIIPLLIKAQSRASYLGFAAMYIAFIIFSKKLRMALFIGALLIISIIPLTGGMYKTLKERVEYTFSGDYSELNLEPSARARLITWQEKVGQKWPKKPLTGWGITGQGFIDSQYVRTLVEIGLIGFTLFMLLLYKIFETVIKIYKRLEIGWEKGITIGFICAYIGLLFHAITTNTFIIVRIMEPFWFMLAIILTFPKSNKSINL